MKCSLPSSSVHGIFQARILEWVATSSSSGSSQPKDYTHISCIGRQILYHLCHLESLHVFSKIELGCTLRICYTIFGNAVYIAYTIELVGVRCQI